MSKFPEHPLRKELSEEVHARPYGLLRAPVRVSHLAVLSGEGEPEGDRRHVAVLCGHFGVTPPQAESNHYSNVLETVAGQELRFKWERHTEFSSYSFYLTGAFYEPFSDNAIDRIPDDWLAALQRAERHPSGAGTR